MLADCQTAEDVRRLAARQAGWRRQMFAPPKPTPAPVLIEQQMVELPKIEPPPQPKPPSIIVAPPLPFIPIALIQRVVCARYNISLHEMLADRRTANLVRPRHVAMWLAKKLTMRSLPEIGRRFCGRDHTTVLSACRSIDAKRAVDPELVALMDELESELMA